MHIVLEKDTNKDLSTIKNQVNGVNFTASSKFRSKAFK